jgi:hypothetical protein
MICFSSFHSPKWRYHIGNDVFVTIKAPFPFVHIRKHFIPADEWTYRPTKRGVALHFGEWKELKQIIPGGVYLSLSGGYASLLCGYG